MKCEGIKSDSIRVHRLVTCVPEDDGKTHATLAVVSLSKPPGPALKERWLSMLLGSILLTYTSAAIGGIALCLLVSILTSSQQDHP